MPTPSEPSFAADIAPLFRREDVEAMEWAFDLRSDEQVRANAGDMLVRLEEGTMPPDEPWPAERIALFRAWIDAGCPA